MTKQKNSVPLPEDGTVEAEMVPAQAADIIDPAAMSDLFEGTTGSASSPLEALATYNQGKDDYFVVGGTDDERRSSVRGIFLYSQRPLRAHWDPTKDMDGSPPECWSFDNLGPHDDVEKAGNATCKDCPWDQLGTAKVGKGKACKTKAADFILEVRDDVNADAEGVAVMDSDDVVGGALLRYSIANREGRREFQGAIRAAKAMGRPLQGVLVEWGWQTTKSKSGVAFKAIKMTVLGKLPDPKEAPELWQGIIAQVTQLKGGQALEVLQALSAPVNQDD